MQPDRIKPILRAAAGLPPAHARRVIAALADKLGTEADVQALGKAAARDMRPLAEALFSAGKTGDRAAQIAALKKISKGLPALAAKSDHLAAEITRQCAAAYLGV